MTRGNASNLPAGAQSGFSLTELLVTVTVLTLLLVGALTTFDFNSKMARVQMQISEMQQSLRVGQDEIVRTLRMSGRGGLSLLSASRVFPAGVAIEVRNDVGTGSGAPSAQVAIGYANSPVAVAGTDILTVRGVFSSPIYQVNPMAPGSYTFDNDNSNSNTPSTDPRQAIRGTVTFCDISHTLIPQSLDPLKRAINDKVHAALILVSSADESFYGVVELDPDNSAVLPAPCANNATSEGIRLAFFVTGGTYAASYRQLSGIPVNGTGAVDGNLPLRLDRVAWVGMLEEYRYYIRSDRAIEGNAASEVAPRLSRATMYPGTEIPAGGLQDDLADNIMDLQVALALDRNGDRAIPADDTPSATDEWLYNFASDDPVNSAWLNRPAVGLSGMVRSVPINYVRVTLLARTDRRDPKYQAPLLGTIESRNYASDAANNRDNRMYRRRTLQTVVSLRNL